MGVRKAKTPEDGTRTIATNRRARHDYTICDQLEVGIALQGSEVKSLRAGNCSLDEAFARVEANELWLHGMHIAPYPGTTGVAPPPRRPRKLLAHRAEIRRLGQRAREDGYTLVPLRVYFSGGKAKIALGLCKGKALYDKREAIKRRDEQREAQRIMRQR